MVTSACAAPLIVDFGGFVALMPRNEPPFTCVHSHAGAQKSSGVFFSDTDGDWCRKWPSGRRNALRASRAVRARTLMLNKTLRAAKMKPGRLLSAALLVARCISFQN